jgi:hypothetical protein
MALFKTFHHAYHVVDGVPYAMSHAVIAKFCTTIVQKPLSD